MKQVSYVCEGSCHGSVSEAEFKSGKNKCAAKSCEDFGKPLKKKVVDMGCC